MTPALGGDGAPALAARPARFPHPSPPPSPPPPTPPPPPPPPLSPTPPRPACSPPPLRPLCTPLPSPALARYYRPTREDANVLVQEEYSPAVTAQPPELEPRPTLTPLGAVTISIEGRPVDLTGLDRAFSPLWRQTA